MTEAVNPITRIAVLTSGGDAQGMNPALRAVVRTALHHGVGVAAVSEGYQGLVDGGRAIKRMGVSDVGGILHLGGTFIGTARSKDFRTREGRRRAARNLLEHGVDGLVVIGGDGSLTGANMFREEWPALVTELADRGEIDYETAAAHPFMRLVGLVGSIDNDMFGTDMTIGADSALHRITEAVDALRSTASSHQRAFVVEVMGRHCGYLALMSSLATGANWVLIPENPPESDDWPELMCAALREGRDIGRRQNVVVVAEGAHDRQGTPITADRVKDILEERLGEDTRVTILGHVQRGGAPSAFDRYLSTLLGHAAVVQLLKDEPGAPAQLIGIREHEVISTPLMQCVEKTHALADHIESGDYETAMQMRGGSFRESYDILWTLTQAKPRPKPADARRWRIGIVHGGGPAPGMNTAVRVAVRLGMDRGDAMFGVHHGFRGLRDGDLHQMSWMSVSGWVSSGGAEMGTNRYVPDADGIARIAQQLAEHRIDALLVIGGWNAYEAAYALHAAREEHESLSLPIVCLPASINNDLPASELSIGSDTALNSIALNIDKIKQSAVASRRCFIVEVRGRDCGYLALMSGLATGAERVYMPEEGVSLADLQTDVTELTEGFRAGKRLGLMIRNENADAVYTTDFMRRLFEKEGGELYDAREAVLGHIQEGGDPSPFDRIQATRLTSRCIAHLAEQLDSGERGSAMIGLQAGAVAFTDLARYPDLVEPVAQRPIEQRWMNRRPLAQVMVGRMEH